MGGEAGGIGTASTPATTINRSRYDHLILHAERKKITCYDYHIIGKHRVKVSMDTFTSESRLEKYPWILLPRQIRILESVALEKNLEKI